MSAEDTSRVVPFISGTYDDLQRGTRFLLRDEVDKSFTMMLTVAVCEKEGDEERCIVLACPVINGSVTSAAGRTLDVAWSQAVRVVVPEFWATIGADFENNRVVRLADGAELRAKGAPS